MARSPEGALQRGPAPCNGLAVGQSLVATPRPIKADPGPVTLAVPDGTWAQARRCARRAPLLAAAQAVMPPDAGPIRYALRYEHVEGGLDTGEAIARAFAILEGAEVAGAIERRFHLTVSRTLQTRRTPRPE